MDVDGGDGQGAQDKAMIIDDRELFFPFLMFMARIADVRPPFLTTVLEPSPCKIETSSWSVAWRWMTEASNNAW